MGTGNPFGCGGSSISFILLSIVGGLAESTTCMPLPLADDDALTASRHETTEMGGGTEDGITTGGFCIDTAHAHVDDSDSSPSSLARSEEGGKLVY